MRGEPLFQPVGAASAAQAGHGEAHSIYKMPMQCYGILQYNIYFYNIQN